MFSFLIPLYVVLWIAGVATHFVFARRLRALDPELADRLHPGLMRKSISSDVAAIGFLLRGKFRDLNDPGFVRLGEFYRALLVAFFVVFLATFVAFAMGS